MLLGKYQTINNKLKKFKISFKKSLTILTSDIDEFKLGLGKNLNRGKQDEDDDDLVLGKTIIFGQVFKFLYFN
jgi:hypothetical protein